MHADAPHLDFELVHAAEVAGGGRLVGPVDKPPRVLKVARGDLPVAALRSDGYALTRLGPTDVRALWRGGNSPRALACRLLSEIEEGSTDEF